MDKNINEDKTNLESKIIDKQPEKKIINDNDGNKLLSDAQVDVGIKPDVKSNDVKVQFCSFSFNLVFNCCSSHKEPDSDE